MALKHHPAAIRKLHTAIRAARQHLPPACPPLLFLTDPTRTPDPIHIAAALPTGSGVIYRHFGAENRVTTARALASLSQRRGLTFLIGADPGLAREVGADGVHWPEAKLVQVPHWRGAFRLNTMSAHSPMAVRRATEIGMDAALVSTVFPSNSPSASRPMGPARFRLLAQTAPLPVYALGGVNPSNAGQVASFAGLAAIDGLAQLS